jgi:DNA-binding transcriptional LysR family regulator
MTEFTGDGGGVLRLGIPLELPPAVLSTALNRLAAQSPATRVFARHLSTGAQMAALKADELDVGLVRERPPGGEFDAMLVATERLGVLVAADQVTELAGPAGVRLEDLSGLQWVGFPRSGSPAWYDEVTSILRSHGIDLGPAAPEDQALIAAVKFASVTAGRAFALAPPNWVQPIPETVAWLPLVGHPLVRRTWVVWPAGSRRRDLAQLITAFEPSADP